MSTITWPSSIVPSRVRWGIKANTQVFVSDLNGSVQTVELPGARITCTLEMPPLEREDAAELEAFIAKLRGQANRAQIPVFGRLTARGVWGGSPVVDNEVGSPTLSQTGSTLYVRGLTAGTTGKKGTWFNLGSGGQLLQVLDDFTADGSGKAQLTVGPPIRTAPADGTALVITDPVLPKAILDDPHVEWELTPSGTPNDNFAGFRLAFTEVFE